MSMRPRAAVEAKAKNKVKKPSRRAATPVF
jgi:hypothetical protein